jgi:hypothetical protein
MADGRSPPGTSGIYLLAGDTLLATVLGISPLLLIPFVTHGRTGSVAPLPSSSYGEPRLLACYIRKLGGGGLIAVQRGPPAVGGPACLPSQERERSRASEQRDPPRAMHARARRNTAGAEALPRRRVPRGRYGRADFSDDMDTYAPGSVGCDHGTGGGR